MKQTLNIFITIFLLVVSANIVVGENVELDSSQQNNNEIIQILETDKDVYEHDEDIEMTLTLKNPTEEDVKITGSGGINCRVKYELDGDIYLSQNQLKEEGVACTGAAIEINLEPGESIEENFIHSLSEYPVEEGQHKIEANSDFTVATEGVELKEGFSTQIEVKSSNGILNSMANFFAGLFS